MAVRISISEIINQCSKFKTADEKAEWLKKNDSQPLRQILQVTYDKDNVEWLVPDTPPPWTKNEYEDEAKALLYKEARRLKIFLKGGGYDNLDQVKRESLFISLLEDIDNDDADLLANHSIAQKPFKGLQKKTINKAFPGLIKE
jgi:hypothetical protein